MSKWKKNGQRISHYNKKGELRTTRTGFYCPQPITNSPSINVFTASRCTHISSHSMWKSPKKKIAQKRIAVEFQRKYNEHINEANDPYVYHVRAHITKQHTSQVNSVFIMATNEMVKVKFETLYDLYLAYLIHFFCGKVQRLQTRLINLNGCVCMWMRFKCGKRCVGMHQFWTWNQLRHG